MSTTNEASAIDLGALERSLKQATRGGQPSSLLPRPELVKQPKADGEGAEQTAPAAAAAPRKATQLHVEAQLQIRNNLAEAEDLLEATLASLEFRDRANPDRVVTQNGGQEHRQFMAACLRCDSESLPASRRLLTLAKAFNELLS